MIRIFVFVLLTLLATLASAQSIEIIQLKNRSVGEIIPIVRPLLKPNEAITGTGGALGPITVNNIALDPWVYSVFLGTTF